jgi:hypothetical protein
MNTAAQASQIQENFMSACTTKAVGGKTPTPRVRAQEHCS